MRRNVAAAAIEPGLERKKSPAGAGAPVPLLMPHAAQHERADRAGVSGQRDQLYHWYCLG